MTDEQFKIDAQGNARVNAIGKLYSEKVDFGDRTNFQQRVSVMGLDLISPEHNPHEWIDRTEPQRDLLERLQTQRLIELVAVGGFGKSLLVTWLFHKVGGEFDRSLWLNFRKAPTFNECARWVLQEIGFLIDDPRVTDEKLSLELVYRLTEKRCLLVLDQLEAVQNGNDRASFEQFLQTWRQRGRSSVVVVTTRSSFGVDAIAEMPLAGLTEAEGATFLAKQGIRAIAQQGFERLTQLANGHPLLLGLAASWVRQEAKGDLDEKSLEFFQRLFYHYQGDSEAKVEEIFAVLVAELPEQLRSLLLGVVVYRDAFGLEMAQAMLEDGSIQDLQALSDQAFLRQELEQWTLHPLMRGLVEQELKESDQHRASHERAIAYFTSKIKSEKESIADCAAELEIFHHCCELKEYDLAKQIMDTCVNFLDLRGYYSKLLPIYEQLTHDWALENPDDAEEQRSLGWAWGRLGNLYQCVERYQAALNSYQNALAIMRDLDDLKGEASVLNCSGDVYNFLGQHHLAITFHQQSLEIDRKVSDWYGEACSLTGLGNAYRALGQIHLAIDFHQQALDIRRRIGEQRGQEFSLIGLGNAYTALGQYQQAIAFYQQALEIDRKIGDRNGEAVALHNLGSVYQSLGQYQRAIDFHQQWLEIAREIGDRNGEANSLLNLSVIYQQCGQFKRSRSYRQQSYRIWQELKLPLEAHPFPEFQKRLLRHSGDDWIEQLLENEQKLGWLLDTISLITLLIRWLFSPIRGIQRRLKSQK